MATAKSGKGKDLDYRVLSSLDEIELPELQNFYKYWLSIKGDLKAPRASDFDLLDVPDMVSNCGVLEVIDGGKDFRIRFLGQGYTLMIQSDPTGKLVSEGLDDIYARRSMDILKLTTTKCVPVINGLRAPSVKLVEADIIQSLTLPLIHNDIVTEIAFAVVVPDLD